MKLHAERIQKLGP